MKKYATGLLLLVFIFCESSFANNNEPLKQKVDLKFMNLKKIEIDSNQAIILTELDISGNPVSDLPANLMLAKNLKTLKLNFCTRLNLNQLISLLQKTSIEEIELNNCNLSYIPFEIAGSSSLKRISLKNNNIQEIPWNLFYNSKLEYLNLESNDIDNIGKEVVNLSNLTYLNLSYNACLNQIDLYAALQQLTNLQTLECSGAGKLPKEWALPQNLKELILNDCRADFPDKILACENLQKLSVQNYNYGEAEKVMQALACNNITDLSLSGSAINKIPKEISNFKKLENLTIETKKLVQISENLRQLVNLKNLRLKIEDTVSLANFLKELSNNNNLTEMDLSDNKFKVFPNEISYLRSLKKIRAQNTGLNSMGEGIFKLNNITEIDLRGNDINTKELEKLIQKFAGIRMYYDQINPLAKNKFINKPFPSINVKPELFALNPGKDTTIITQNGTKITIPSNALVDKKGKAIKENVQLSFTTYFDPLEVFVSGIPMTADSSGTKKSFASAGMFTYNATFSNNQQAFVRKGSKMKIDFVSSSPNTSYNYYYLDTVQKNWVQTGKDKVTNELSDKIKLKKRYPRMPSNPNRVYFTKLQATSYEKKKKGVSPTFSLGLHDAENKRKKSDSAFYVPYEIKDFTGIKWKFTGTNVDTFYHIFSGIGSPYFETYWTDKKKKAFSSRTKEGVEVIIRPDKEKDCFNIVFSTYSDSVVIEAIPLIDLKNPERVQKKAKKLYDKYYADLSSNDSHRTARMKRFSKEYNLYRVKMENYNKLWEAFNNNKVSVEEYQKMFEKMNKNELDSINKGLVTLDNLTRSMELTGFGTYNCDYFQRIENPIVTAPNFVNSQDNSRLSVSKVTLIDLDENAYIETEQNKIKLARNRNYWIFTQTTDNKIGFSVVTAQDKTVKNILVKFVSANSVQELRNQLKY